MQDSRLRPGMIGKDVKSEAAVVIARPVWRRRIDFHRLELSRFATDFSKALDQRFDSVVARAAMVPEPVAIRYAWANAPEASLFIGAGLPASPFRSDN